ncbi:MAG: GNAT family N-acetyltransferase [Eudoraea sp.]|nr:GNAT family N-acetyltransferase [Eudoraea sp.]MBT8293100.1 GNAT family N-acetyltransferase [Eudoraea sp.]NNL02422.1 GNAT family N-acetyltransferase [Eudoraea sp.]
MILKGKHTSLRALEPEDLDFLFELENNPHIWEISGTITPYSRHVLKKYLDNAHRDIYEVKQLRLAICNESNKVIGFIDLFDFDPKHRRAGIGIVILDRADRNNGHGSEAVSLLCKYAFKVLNLNQVYANVGEDNQASIQLFKKMGFELAGVKKDWVLAGGKFKNELLFQKFEK